MTQLKWSAEIVILAIQKRHRRAWKLNAYYVETHCSRLYSAAIRYFGTWNKALAAAQVPIPYRNTWSKEIIVQKIKELAERDQPLNNHYIKQTHGILYTVSCQYFGGWGKAVEAAGIDYHKVCRTTRRSWSKKTILEEIVRRYKEGLSLSGMVVQKEDSGLYDAALLHFGTPKAWARARQAAGLPPRDLDPRFIHDPEVVSRELRRLYDQGVLLNFGALRGTQYIYLVTAGKRLFGSYQKAIKAAGLDYSKIKKRRRNWWTKQRVIAGIKRLEKSGVRLSMWGAKGALQTLIASANRLFGSWSKAVEAADINYRKHIKIWSTKQWLQQMDEVEYQQKLATKLHKNKKKKT